MSKWLFRLPLLWGLLLGATLLFVPTATAEPRLQSRIDEYWRYEAQGEITLIEQADVDGDGIDELLLVADQQNLVYLQADGTSEWQLTSLSTPITALAVVAQNNNQTTANAIVIGTQNRLILVSVSGQIIWETELFSAPIQIQAFDENADGIDEILLANRMGRLQLYSAESGELIWSYVGVEPPNVRNARPQLMTADFDQDGLPEIIFTYVAQRGFAEVLLVSNSGRTRWAISFPGRVTTVEPFYLDEGAIPQVALGTSRGVVYLIEGKTGATNWMRTPNRPITAMATIQSATGGAVIAGTDAGMTIAYDHQGRRLWDQIYSDTATQAIVEIAAIPNFAEDLTSNAQVLITVAGQEGAGPQTTNNGFVVDGQGALVDSVVGNSNVLAPQIIDMNHDGHVELLLPAFSTLSLKDAGLGGRARSYYRNWTYQLDAKPAVVFPYSTDQEAIDARLIVAGQDNRLHQIASASGDIMWTLPLDGPAVLVDVVETAVDASPMLVVGYNVVVSDEQGNETFEGWLDLIRTDGVKVWPVPVQFRGPLTTLEAIDLNGGGKSEILVGTTDGELSAYSLGGERLWQAILNGAITHLKSVVGPDERPRIIATTASNQLYMYNNKGQVLDEMNGDFADDIVDLVTRANSPEVIIATSGGRLLGYGLDLEPKVDIDLDVGSNLRAVQATEDALIISLDEARIVGLSLGADGSLDSQWSITELERDTATYWGDIDGDTTSEIVIGTQTGELYFYNEAGQLLGDLALTSAVYEIVPDNTGPQRLLLAVTENGVVHGLGSTSNRPPLLLNPRMSVEADRYSFDVTVRDIDSDPVSVALYVYDLSSDRWISQGERLAPRGDDRLFWVTPGLASRSEVQYRFVFDDGVYAGTMTPTPRMVPPVPSNVNPYLVFLGLLAVFLVGGYVLRRNVESVPWRSGRFYRTLMLNPQSLTTLLANAYVRTRGSPDFLLNLASRARRNGQSTIAMMADGLFLLADRTPAGLELLVSAFELKSDTESAVWDHESYWYELYRVTLALLVAPSPIEIGLLRPQLLQLINLQQETGVAGVGIEALLRPLTSLRDSTRVHRTDDRLTYLHEALVLLRQEQEILLWRPTTIQNAIASAISNRWSGLINAAIEDMRGRPWLTAELKTKRLVSDKETLIALEVMNSGQAAAEQLQVSLQDNAHYSVTNSKQEIPYLPVGRSTLINFTIAPHTEDAFRLTFVIAYKDAHMIEHQFEFADRIRLLDSSRDFQPIINPYSPGTPLRQKSRMFFGRENLLHFIIDYALRIQQQNVLILVGQRRTGKTSALLRLERLAPEQLLPVYVDCQSFGVLSGMAAFLHDLGWFIADAMESRGYVVEMADLAVWEQDPHHYFQREFLPSMFALLPPDTRMLLIFDEFEVFENLVSDGILPRNFFPFLRHLMQHGEGLNFVFAGTHRLEEMGSDYWSVLFNIALYRQIDYLDQSAAWALISEPVAPHILYDDLALDKIWRVTAGHPYFLQLVCYALINRANQRQNGYVTISDVNIALKEMLKLGEAHFAYLWQHSSFVERALLTAAAHLYDTAATFDAVALSVALQDYDIYLEPAAIPVALNSLVTRGILREVHEAGISLYEMRIGLVGLWVAENKSLSKLYELS